MIGYISGSSVKNNILYVFDDLIQIQKSMSRCMSHTYGVLRFTRKSNITSKPILNPERVEIKQQTRKYESRNRRQSLTLATTWGDQFFGKFAENKNNALRMLHTEFRVVDKNPKTLKTCGHQIKRRSSQAAALDPVAFESASRCPFHAHFKSDKNRDGNVTDPQNGASNLHWSTSEPIITSLRSFIKSYHDAISESPRRAMNFLKTLLRNDAITSSETKSCTDIPGPKGLPLLGSVLDYTFLGPFSPRQFHKALLSRHARYGKIFREKFLSEEFVYISDPSDVEVLIHNEDAAPCRPQIDAIVESRTQQGYPVGITALQGAEWARLRSALNSAIMRPKVVLSYKKAQKEVTDDFMKFIENERSPSTGEVENLEVWLNRWALESVAVILLDTRLGLINPDGKKSADPIAERLRTAMDVFFDYGARLTFSAPVWKILKTKTWKIFCQSQKDEFECAGHYVDKKLKDIEKTTKSDVHCKKVKDNKPTSFLEHLLNKSDLKRNESLTLCLELLAGGIDTSSNAVTFTLYELSKNSKCQEKLRNLIMEDQTNNVSGTNSKSSRYLRACVMESLRLHPLTYVNMRQTNRDLILSGYRIEAGTTVRYTNHLVHLKNEKYFPEANKFIPDRWVSRQSPHRCTKQFVFTPFGHGARQCPGRRIAEQELDLLLREIMKKYSVEYHHEDIGTQVRLFNCADKPAKFSFVPLEKEKKN